MPKGKGRRPRPHFGPRQVRTLKGICRGNTYRLFQIISGNGYGSGIVLALTDPQKDSFGRHFFWALDWPRYGLPKKIYCAEAGVVKYVGGFWDKQSRMTRTGRRRLSDDELYEILNSKSSR